MIAAMAPRYKWRPNHNGITRSIDEAVHLAQQWGVAVPEYVEFHVEQTGYPLENDTFARTTRFREFNGTVILWEKFFNVRGRIPFIVRADVFQSDEAIVAVIGHEVFELELLRITFDSKEPIEKWEAETSPKNPGNFHSRAWDYADSLVEKMRAIE